jgi:hypothetical protein
MDSTDKNSHTLIGVQEQLLQVVLNVNKLETEECSVCLLVNGIIICGKIISIKEYQKIRGITDIVHRNMAEEENPSTVHLKNIKIFSGKLIFESELWIVNLCSIDGVSIGFPDNIDVL